MDVGESVSLSVPLVTRDGRTLTELVVRPANVADMRAAKRRLGTEVDQEVGLIANLCGIRPCDVDQLLVVDYQRLVKAAFPGRVE